MGYVNEIFKVYNNKKYQILEKSSFFVCICAIKFIEIRKITCEVVEKFFPAACLAIETDKRENILLIFFDADVVCLVD